MRPSLRRTHSYRNLPYNVDLDGEFCLINHSPLTLKKSKKVFTPFRKTSEIFLSVSGGTLTKPKIL
jgi:hypothetical protein